LNDELDGVFKALADPNRRMLLDLLRVQDGQTLKELTSHLPMTRFGAMKHLRVLEEAGLVVSRKAGRTTQHFLNAVPIQRISERWVGRYEKIWSQRLIALKAHLEEPMVAAAPKVYELIIATTPEKLWQALTDGAMTQQYFFGSKVESTFKPGAPIVYKGSDGGLMVEGEILEADPPNKLVHTFRAVWDEGMSNDPPSRVTYEIERQGTTCLLRLVHDELLPGSATERSVQGGWPTIVSSLKTLLETGKALPQE
jgi:uncharacterized protein YndB with AHSA1/START domain/DNA-binding transcriptional ArsR family regulator